MNERWELHEEFTFEEAILIALELDGCFESLNELAKIVERGRGQFIETYPDESQIAAFRALDKIEIKRLLDKAQKMKRSLDSLLQNGFFSGNFRPTGTFECSINKTGLSHWLERIGKDSLSKIFAHKEETPNNELKSQLDRLRIENDELKTKLSQYDNPDSNDLRLSSKLFIKAIGAMACAADFAAPTEFKHGGSLTGSKFRKIIVDKLGIADLTNIDKVINRALKHPDIKNVLDRSKN